ncbi:alpha-amylase family protein [Desulfosporosinus sp. SB140]|uniref:alpha-amylase family protein n=1 Tax=Desulfosporosinus paludis TaxID=3115649 RepID=UPI00388E8C06
MKKQWYQKQLRMVQTVLREPDIINYDARAVVDYLDRVKANCIIINAGGVIDFFKSDLEMAKPNQFMTTENVLGDLVKEAHKRNIKVLVRVDFRGVERERYEQKPAWFGKNLDGTGMQGITSLQIKNDGTKTRPFEIYSPCYNGYYANQHAVKFIQYLMDHYDIDGVWENALCFSIGPCYCETCREKYKKDTGKDIPVGDDYTSGEFNEYRNWKAGCVDSHIKLLRDTVKSYGEDKAFCAEIFGMFHHSLAFYCSVDLYNAKKHFDFLVSPAFLSHHHPNRVYDILSYSASSVRFMKSLNKNMQTVLLYGNHGQLWRYVKDPQLENKIWLWEAVSVGGNFWNCMFNGQHPDATFDRRSAYLEADVFSYLADNEELLDGQTPVEDIGIYFSKPSRDALAKDDENVDGYGVFIKGVERVLVDNHIQYNFILDIDLSLEKIKDLKLLILPNAAFISDEQINIIKEYVKNGGGLIASYETSLYDEKGNRREDFGLKDLFGCSYTGTVKNTSADCYQMIHSEDHPVLAGINNTALLMNGGSMLLCTANNQEGYDQVCNYIPIIPNQPPEYAWLEDMKTEFPTIMAGTYGLGKVVYFANQTDKLCHTNGHEDFIDTFFNAIKWTLQGKLSLTTNAPNSVHIALTENNEGYVLSLINLTSGPTKPIRQLQPVYNFFIDISSGIGINPGTKVLKQDGDIKAHLIEREDGEKVLRIEVSMIREFTSIYLKRQ